MLDEALKTKIRNEFNQEEFLAVKEALLSVSLAHVMANSEYNLNNTRHAIVQLAQGNMDVLKNMVDAAKLDFRNVILWASEQEHKKK